MIITYQARSSRKLVKEPIQKEGVYQKSPTLRTKPGSLPVSGLVSDLLIIKTFKIVHQLYSLRTLVWKSVTLPPPTFLESPEKPVMHIAHGTFDKHR